MRPTARGGAWIRGVDAGRGRHGRRKGHEPKRRVEIPLYIGDRYIILSANARLELKKMSETQKKTVRVSSAYTRVVGNNTLDVVNTKQQTGLPKKAYNKKWVVLMRNGRKTTIVAQTDKKYDSIDALLEKEKQLKADEAKKDE